MNMFSLSNRFRRLSVPGALLFAFLQRTPVVQLTSEAETVIVDSPIGNVLRAVIATVAAVGTMHSMAGATPLVATPPQDSNGLSTSVGASVNVFFDVQGTQTEPASWRVTGSFPPGLKFSGLSSDGTVNVQNLNLTGTPTSPGSFTVTITAYEGPNASLIASPDYMYTITVTGGTGTAPSINTQPTNQTVSLSNSATFSVTATGSPAPTYQWQFGGADIAGATNASLTKSNVQTSDAGTYDVVVSNSAGSVTSNRVTLTVNSPPRITTQPQAQSATVGGSVTFTVGVDGTAPFTYQWFKGGANIPGATSASLTLNNLQAADAANYSVTVSNTVSAVTSNSAALTVNPAGNAPSFTVQPASQTIAAGSTVVFTATASGTPNYQWQKNGANLTGATGPIFVINNAAAGNAGTYTVVASNSGANVTSNGATLTVATVSPSDAGRLTNLSVRTFSGTGDQVLSVGFAAGGAGTSGAKPILARVTGPALAGFGVSGTMADPTLSIQPLGSSTVLAANDNWGGDATVKNTSNAVGAFPITDTASLDSGLVTSIPNNTTCTAIAAGKSSGTGIVLTEIYDATPSASVTASTPRLVNVSARANAGTGDNILTVGFAISGTTSKTVLIRATGPALANFGVTGALADPKLTVFILNGPKLYDNDNWGGSAVITNTGNSVGAFPITDPQSKDAVLLVTLPPGVYTAQITGADGGTGIALVEVYDVP